MYLLILVCFVEHIAIYATTLMGRGTMYDKYLLWFKAEIHPLRFFCCFTTFKTSTQRILSRIRRSFDWFS